MFAKDPLTGDRKVIRSHLWVHSEDANDRYCNTYFINHGLRVKGRTLIVEFRATGAATGFECSVDRMAAVQCKISKIIIITDIYIYTTIFLSDSLVIYKLTS